MTESAFGSTREAAGWLLELDVRDRPLYTVAEAARYLGVPAATLRAWTKGRGYPTRQGEGWSEPLISLPPGSGLLSFHNLVEANVLAALRRVHDVPMARVRAMIDFAREKLGAKRPLLLDLHAGLGEVFVVAGERLLALSRAGQLALREVIEQHLARVERDEHGLAVRYHPSLPPRLASEFVVLDPKVAFGAPTVRGVRTEVIALRFNAGETLDEIAADYRLTPEEVHEAVLFEGSGRAAIEAA